MSNVEIFLDFHHSVRWENQQFRKDTSHIQAGSSQRPLIHQSSFQTMRQSLLHHDCACTGADYNYIKFFFFHILLQIADWKDFLSFGEGKKVCSDRKKTCNVEKREQASFFVETASQTVREWRGKSKLSEAIFVDFRHELTYTI